MRFGKTFALAGAIAACSGAFAAEGTRRHEIIPNLEYGFEAFTGYNTNVNASPTDAEESFMVTIRPFLRYEKELAFGPLTLAYNPEMRWYENRSADSVEWDHVFSAGSTINLTPMMTLSLNDTFSNVDTEDITEVGGVTTGGSNAYIRNMFTMDYTWEFKTGQQLIAGYSNEYLDYDASIHDYRNNKTNEVYLGYQRSVSNTTKLGVKLIHGASNFYSSEKTYGGVKTDRDQEWTRLVWTSEISSGPWELATDFGFEYYRNTSDVVDTAKKSTMEPYFKAKLDYFFTSQNVLSAAYVYRTIPGYREDIYFAKQSQARLGYNHAFSERLTFDITATYDNLYYDLDFSRNGTFGDDRDEWLRTGFKFTYKWKQNVDVLLGYSYDSLLNAVGDKEEYSIDRYNVGLSYKF